MAINCIDGDLYTIQLPPELEGQTCFDFDVVCNDAGCETCRDIQTICLCSDKGECGPCQDCIGGVCVDLCPDQACFNGQCAECDDNTPCPCDQICRNGNCVCPTGRIPNGDCCVDCDNDNPCPPCYDCVGGTCLPKCPDSQCDPETEACVECTLDGHCDQTKGCRKCEGNKCVCCDGYTLDTCTGECVPIPIGSCNGSTPLSTCESCQNIDSCTGYGTIVPVDCGAGRICIDGLGCREECDCQTGGCSEAGAVCAEANALQCYCKNCSDFSCVEEGASACGGANSRECICNDVGQCVPDPCAGIVCPVGQVCVDGQCVDDGEPCDTSVTLEKIEDGNNCDLKASWANDCCPCPALEATITPTISGNNVDFSLQFKKNGSNLSDERQDNKVVGNDQEIPTSGSVCARVSYLQEIVIDLGGGQTRTRTVVTKSIEYPGASFNGSDVLDINGVPINLGPVVGGNNIEARVDIILKPTENSNSNCTWGGDNGAEYYSYRVTDINQIDVQTNTINSSDCGNAIVEWNRDDLGDFIRVYTDLNEHVLKGVEGDGLEDENLQRKILGDQFGRLESCHTYKATVCCCGEGNATEDVVFCKSIEEATAESLNICNTEIRVQIPDSCDVNDKNDFIITLSDGQTDERNMRDHLPYDSLSAPNSTFKSNQPITFVKVEMICSDTGERKCATVIDLPLNIELPSITAECVNGSRVLNATGGRGVISALFNGNEILNRQYTVPNNIAGNASITVIYGTGEEECYRETTNVNIPSVQECCTMSVNAGIESQTQCGATTGTSTNTLTLSVFNGQAPYVYTMDGVNINSNNTQNSFSVQTNSSGTRHTWSVLDSNGCRESGVINTSCQPVVTTPVPPSCTAGGDCTVNGQNGKYDSNCNCSIPPSGSDTCVSTSEITVPSPTGDQCESCKQVECTSSAGTKTLLGNPICGRIQINCVEECRNNPNQNTVVICGNTCRCNQDEPEPQCNLIECSDINPNNICPGNKEIDCCSNGVETSINVTGTSTDSSCATGADTCDTEITAQVNKVDTSANSSTGSISITNVVGGDTSNYNYEIFDLSTNPPTLVTTATIANNLPAGDYEVRITDGDNCRTSYFPKINTEPLVCPNGLCQSPNNAGTACEDVVHCPNGETKLGTSCAVCDSTETLIKDASCNCTIQVDTEPSCSSSCANIKGSINVNINNQFSAVLDAQDLISPSDTAMCGVDPEKTVFNCDDIANSPIAVNVLLTGNSVACTTNVTVTDTENRCNQNQFYCKSGTCTEALSNECDSNDCFPDNKCDNACTSDCDLANQVAITQAGADGKASFCFTPDANGTVPSYVLNAVPGSSTGNYSYNWAPGGQTSSQAINSTGTYTVTVTDNNDSTCTGTATIEVGEVCLPACDGVTITVTAYIKDSDCGENNGSIRNIGGSGGTGPYSGTSALVNQASGSYTVTLTDDNGCKGSRTFVIGCNTDFCDNCAANTCECGKSCDDADCAIVDASTVPCGDVVVSDCEDGQGQPCWTVTGTGCPEGEGCGEDGCKDLCIGVTCSEPCETCVKGVCVSSCSGSDICCGDKCHPVCTDSADNAPCCCGDGVITQACTGSKKLNTDCLCVE